MRTIVLTAALVLGNLLTPIAADGQPPPKMARIGMLCAAVCRGPTIEAFLQGLRELRWIEGQNLAIEYRWAEGKYDRLPELAAEMVRLKVDLIFTPGGTTAPQAAKDATRTIPIVFTGVGDPVGSGFVASLARPGGNMTGLSHIVPGTTAKRLQLLKEAIPRATRVAVLWHTANPSHPPQFEETESAARTLGIRLQFLGAGDPTEFEGTFSAMTRGRADGLLLFRDPMFTFHGKRLADLALKHRLPAMFGARQAAEEGGLMAYGPSFADLARRAATYVDKILKGAKPRDLPVEQAMRFELVVNLKTAKALGLTIPQSILIWADKVIQ